MVDISSVLAGFISLWLKNEGPRLLLAVDQKALSAPSHVALSRWPSQYSSSLLQSQQGKESLSKADVTAVWNESTCVCIWLYSSG